MNIKKCNQCKETKPLDHFGIKAYQRTRSDGSRYLYKTRRHLCNPCRTTYCRLNRYKLKIEEFEEMLDKRKYRCDICSTKITKSCHIDHCHSKGHVRGLLCGSCNKGLGFMKDNIETLKKAIDYLKP